MRAHVFTSRTSRFNSFLPSLSGLGRRIAAGRGIGDSGLFEEGGFMTPTLWKYRKFIWVNAVADLRHRFSGSVAGYLWNVLVPLAQIAVFAVIFSGLMGN